jgi:hypothetical protein
MNFNWQIAIKLDFLKHPHKTFFNRYELNINRIKMKWERNLQDIVASEYIIELFVRIK